MPFKSLLDRIHLAQRGINSPPHMHGDRLGEVPVRSASKYFIRISEGLVGNIRDARIDTVVRAKPEFHTTVSLKDTTWAPVFGFRRPFLSGFSGVQ